MGKLAERLKDTGRNGAYAVADPAATEDAAAEAGLACLPIDLAAVTGKRALLEAFARRLGFPDWFGGNWDALEDCLTDLSWSEAAGWVLLISAPAGLAARRPAELRMLIEILDSAARYWSSRGRPFFAVFADPDGALALPWLHRPGRRQ